MGMSGFALKPGTQGFSPRRPVESVYFRVCLSKIFSPRRCDGYLEPKTYSRRTCRLTGCFPVFAFVSENMFTCNANLQVFSILLGSTMLTLCSIEEPNTRRSIFCQNRGRKRRDCS